MKLLGVLEGILFVVGDEGISLETISSIMDLNETEAKELLNKLKESYEKEDRGLRVTYLGDAFKLTTKKEHKKYYEKLAINPEINTLSDAALETLAIIAYNQPITRAEVDAFRGVCSSHMIRKLVAKGLIKEDGKSNLPGRAYIYITTKDFLDYFGLATIKDLPIYKDEKIVTDDIELFTSIYKEE